MEGYVTFILFLFGAHVTQPAPDEYRGLVREFTYALKVCEANVDMKELARVFDEDRRPAKISRFMELVDNQRAGDPEIVDALVWVSKMSPTWGSREPLMSTVGDRARNLLIRHHIDQKRVGLAMAGMMYLDAGSQAAEALFREALAKSPHRDVRGRACYWLAMYLKDQAECVCELRRPPDAFNLQARFEKRWGKDAVEKLKSADPDRLRKEAEGLFARAIEQYADIPTRGLTKDDEPLGGKARKELHELRDLAVGRVAPEILGQDAEGKQFRLSEYRGNVVLLTFSGNWCGPCRAMYPEERDLVKRLNGKHFVILSINTDPERETLRKSMKDGEITWRCWCDGPKRPICAEWNVSSFPTIYIIDAGGVIRNKNLWGRELDDAVKALVLERAGR